MQVKDSTGEDTRKGVQVTSQHQEDLPGSKASANFALKWVRDSKHVAHLNLVEIPKELKNKSKEKVAGCYTASDDGKFVGIVGFECRGLDVIDWEPQVPSALPTLCMGHSDMHACVHIDTLCAASGAY